MTVDLDELEQLEKAATAGPWKLCCGGECGNFYAANGRRHNGQSEAALVVALRNAAPDLIRELRAARERVAELERAVAYAEHVAWPNETPEGA